MVTLGDPLLMASGMTIRSKFALICDHACVFVTRGFIPRLLSLALFPRAFQLCKYWSASCKVLALVTTVCLISFLHVIILVLIILRGSLTCVLYSCALVSPALQVPDIPCKCMQD